MRRVILLVPEGLSFDLLTEAQQKAINGIFGRYVLKPPGTKAHEGKVLCDAICSDTFDPQNMAQLGLSWEVVGMWQWDGVSPSVEAILPLNAEAYRLRMSDQIDYVDGEYVYSPPVLKEAHRWTGHPEMI